MMSLPGFAPMRRHPRRGVILVAVLWLLIFLGFLAVVLRMHMSGVIASVRATEENEAVRVLADAGLEMAAALVRAGPEDGIGTLPDVITGNVQTATGAVAFVTGVISVYASTSGVVLPAFLPTIPGLVARLGGGDPISLATSMNVGAHLVDMSPLSTTGAICLAAVADPPAVRPTFNALLAWGLSMTVIGALVCWLFF